MKVNKEELIEIFKPLKDLCDRNDTCDSCPLNHLKPKWSDVCLCDLYYSYEPTEIISIIEECEYYENR